MRTLLPKLKIHPASVDVDWRRIFLRWWVVSALLAILISVTSEAAVVRRVRGDRALLEASENESFSEGDQLEVRTGRGKNSKRKALLEVISVRDEKILVEIKQGRVANGDRARGIESEDDADESDSNFQSGKIWSAVFGISLDTQTVRISDTARVGMSGNSYAGRVSQMGSFRSRNSVWRYLRWEAGVGLEQIQTSGTLTSGACKGSQNCSFEMLATSPFGRLGLPVYTDDIYGLQVRVGADAILPITVTSNVLEAKPFTPIFLLGAGLHGYIAIDDESGVPVTIDLMTTPVSGGSPLNRLQITAGYSWR